MTKNQFISGPLAVIDTIPDGVRYIHIAIMGDCAKEGRADQPGNIQRGFYERHHETGAFHWSGSAVCAVPLDDEGNPTSFVEPMLAWD